MKPKYYPFSEHKITLTSIDPDALYILKMLDDAGHTAYLVGGSVRDLLLKRQPKDFDISTSATPTEIKRIFPQCLLIGRRFRLAHIRFGKKTFEVSTFRRGETESEDLIVRDNEWGSEAEDVLRRDFTINGLFYRYKDQTIIDYVEGFEDAKQHLLRSIGHPQVRFKQDPVRMIRLIKFRARFDFAIDPLAQQALMDCRHDILHSSSARVLEEILRMLESGASLPFFQNLIDFRFLSILTPALGEYLEQQDPTVLFSFLALVDSLALDHREMELPRPVLLAALIFAPFLHHVRVSTEGSREALHLGEIQERAYFVIHDLFKPFIAIPRKMAGAVGMILTSQFRFAPIPPITEKAGPFRIPKLPDFRLSLKFFQLRSLLDEELLPLHAKWLEKYESRKLSRSRRR